MQQLKEQLYDFCAGQIKKREDSVRVAMKETSQAMETETKSSAGDKYETGLAMLQIEQEKFASQLSVIMKTKQILQQVLPGKKFDRAAAGAVVITNTARYFIAISAGQFQADGYTYNCIAADSPIGKLLLGKSRGDRFVFLNKSVVIEEVL